MRFPHLADAVYNGPATREAIDLIAGLLERDLPDSDLTADLRRFAAAQFLQMVIVMPQRRHTAQNSPMTPKELDQWAQKTVRLFLNGCRGLSGKPETRRAPQRP
jgi:hypothetical protein